MELDDAIAACKEEIRHLFGQIIPSPTDEWVAEITGGLMAQFENSNEDGEPGDEVPRGPIQSP